MGSDARGGRGGLLALGLVSLALLAAAIVFAVPLADCPLCVWEGGALRYSSHCYACRGTARLTPFRAWRLSRPDRAEVEFAPAQPRPQGRPP